MDTEGWKIITKDVDPHDPVASRLLDEAIATSPAGFTRTNVTGEIILENTVAMLPRHPLTGSCRLCGREAELTREHIPPRSSGNKERIHKHTLDEWLKHGLADDPTIRRKTEQGGVFGYTLCRSCNSLTGTLYGTEYKAWTDRANEIIASFQPDTLPRLDQLIGPFGWKVDFGSKETGGMKPGALVRQILSCMCSLSGTWDLAGRYPELRRIILEQSTERLPDTVELGMSLYVGPKVRICGPQLRVDIKTQTWRWYQEIAFPPFAFILTLASNAKNPGLGLMIGEWAELSPDEQKYFSGIAELGFGWTPYPGDYRSRAAISTAAHSSQLS